jgi:hypothetical protein
MAAGLHNKLKILAGMTHTDVLAMRKTNRQAFNHSPLHLPIALH